MGSNSISDPVTDTQWFDLGDLSGSAMTMVTGAIGIGILFFILQVGRNTVTPILNDVGNELPGVQTSEGGGLIVEG